MLNKTLNKAYQEHILSLSIPSAKQEKMKKEVLVVNMTLEYPPHGEFKQYKKEQPRPRYQVKDKRAPRIQYDKRHKDIINYILPLWKSHMQAVLGTHAYMREIPSNGVDGLAIHKFNKIAKSTWQSIAVWRTAISLG